MTALAGPDPDGVGAGVVMPLERTRPVAMLRGTSSSPRTRHSTRSGT